MKIIMFVISVLLFSNTGIAQDITGQWNGALKIQGTQLRIVFHIARAGVGYTGTMDSPDQNATGIQLTSVIFENRVLTIEQQNLKIVYTGTLNDKNIIEGQFKQGGMSFPMPLAKNEIEKQVRLQEPRAPYPYIAEEINFQNKNDSVTLAGTLTMPVKEGKYPAVILVTGSGPQNRDEEIFGHKPFLVIADYLTRHNIAVLRFDDRGIGNSSGTFSAATSKDFAADVLAAVDYLSTRKEIDKKNIGLIGHSEGGIIAPMVAARSKNVAFIILLAGPGLRGDSLLELQQEALARAMGVPDTQVQHMLAANRKVYNVIRNNVNKNTLADSIRAALHTIYENDNIPHQNNTDSTIEGQVRQLVNPWMQFFLQYDPLPALKHIKCPVLALNGEKDLQVPAGPNLDAIKKGLQEGSNKQFSVKELKGLNHLFQECKTGLPAEYGNIDQTFSPVALDEMTGWIKQVVK